VTCGHGWPMHIVPGGVENIDIYPTERHCVDCSCRNYVGPGSEFEAGYRKGAADCRGSVDRMDVLEQQRDVLLAALKAILEDVSREDLFDVLPATFIYNAEAAIAKAEGR
jgi:hypothetical protein